ncbi:MAG TPA: glycosyltransferase 87 family protein [Hyphomicrobiaceae bacterium]|nr:glycosyltransferase 87 family protein [Hyphomicrobiaceae bacterium]
MLSALRSGSFVTLPRLRVYGTLLLAAYAATFLALLATADGIVDAAGRPLGADFASVYAAGKLALAGEAERAYDWSHHHAMQKDVAARPQIGYFPWAYPPTFLGVAAGLAVLPYLAAFCIYQVLAACVYLAAMLRIAGRREAWLPALAFPAAFVSAAHGNDGLLSAGLLGGVLFCVRQRPLLAGVLLGCLSYKLEFWPIIPVVLGLAGYWRAVAATALTALAFAGFAGAAFGGEAFAAFWASLPLTHQVAFEGARGFHKIPSVHGALRLLDAPFAVATVAQSAVTAATLAALAALWRSAAAFELKAAGLIVGCLLATPYALDYDLVVLAPAIAFLAAYGMREGFRDWEVAALAALWVLPLAGRSIASAAAIQLAPIVLAGVLYLVLARAGVLPIRARVGRRREA